MNDISMSLNGIDLDFMSPLCLVLLVEQLLKKKTFNGKISIIAHVPSQTWTVFVELYCQRHFALQP